MIRNVEELRRVLAVYEIPEELRESSISVLAKIVKTNKLSILGGMYGGMAGGSLRTAKNGLPSGLLNHMKEKEETFFDVLTEYMDAKGYKKDSDLYNRIGINRSTFSKFRSGKQNPSRETVLRMALVMELKEDEAVRLLNAAGHAFLLNNMFDRFACYFIEEFSKGVHYDLDTLNEWSVQCTGQAIYGAE